MKIDYLSIIIVSLIKAIFVLNLSKKHLLVPIMTKMIGLLKGMKIDYLTIIIASLNKAIFVLNLSKKHRLFPIMT
jgi:hypothetical protein